MLQLQERTVTLSSEPQQVLEAEKLVEDIKNELSLSEEQSGNIMLCAVEAVRNAIEHGNKFDTAKKVTVHISQQDDMLTIDVSDEGPGFDPSSVADPTAPDNLEKLTGRGVFLIQQLADKTVFKNEGREIEMSFNIGLMI